MARRVVALPPVMVTNPSTPSVPAWSKHLKVRDSSRPPPWRRRRRRSAAGPPTRRPARRPRPRPGPAWRPRGTWPGRAPRARPGRRGPPRSRRWSPRSTGPAGAGRCRRRRPCEAVDHQIAQPAAQRQQHPRRRLDGHGRPGHGGQTLAPGAGGVHDEVGAELALATGQVVADRHPGDPPAGMEQAGDLGERSQPGAALLCGGEEPQRQPHRVHGRVRHPHRRLQGRVQPGLQRQGLGRGQLPGRDATGRAAGQEAGR